MVQVYSEFSLEGLVCQFGQPHLAVATGVVGLAHSEALSRCRNMRRGKGVWKESCSILTIVYSVHIFLEGICLFNLFCHGIFFNQVENLCVEVLQQAHSLSPAHTHDVKNLSAQSFSTDMTSLHCYTLILTTNQN